VNTRLVLPGARGIACWDGSETQGALLGRADAALYEAKRSGRNLSVIG